MVNKEDNNEMSVEAFLKRLHELRPGDEFVYREDVQQLDIKLVDQGVCTTIQYGDGLGEHKFNEQYVEVIMDQIAIAKGKVEGCTPNISIKGGPPAKCKMIKGDYK